MKNLNFFLDIDDTLIPSGNNKISDYTLSVIKKARSLGCSFFINTGRPYCDIPLNIFTDEYFDGICSGGDYVVYHGNTLYSKFMPTKDVRELFASLNGLKEKVNFNLGGLTYRYYIGERQPYFTEGIYRPLVTERDYETLFNDTQLQKYVVSKRLSPDAEVLTILKKYFNVIYHNTYTEGFLHGHGKSFLMKKVEQSLGLSHQNTVAIGDSFNDVDMMQYAAVSVAMGNAPDDVKSICTYVTDTSESDGVAKAILMLINEG